MVMQSIVASLSHPLSPYPQVALASIRHQPLWVCPTSRTQVVGSVKTPPRCVTALRRALCHHWPRQAPAVGIARLTATDAARLVVEVLADLFVRGPMRILAPAIK